MPSIGIAAILAGRLFAAGLACGLNLYVTIALTGLASRLGWIELPPGLIGLEQGFLIAGAAVLFAAEFIAATVPLLDAAWEAAHTVVRPIAGAALAFSALDAAPLWLRLVGAAITGAAALATHSGKIGLRLVVIRSRRRRAIASTAEDIAALLLAFTAIVLPFTALALAALSAVLLALFAPPYWRAFTFAARAARAAIRGFFGTRTWTDRDDLPSALRQLVPPAELGAPEPRAARAALDSPAGPWRNGWLVLDGRTSAFFFRHRFHIRHIPLPRPDSPSTCHTPLADIITWQHQNTRYTLRLLHDGPSAEIVTGALQLAVR